MNFDTLIDDPKLIDVLNRIHSEPWPRFLNESEIINGRSREHFRMAGMDGHVFRRRW